MIGALVLRNKRGKEALGGDKMDRQSKRKDRRGRWWAVIPALLLTVCPLGMAQAEDQGEAPEAQDAAQDAAAVQVIGGVTPDRRPENALFATLAPKTYAWHRWALRGIQPPYPYSLRFLVDQGNWYTPFIRPNMTGLYDWRGLHGY